VTRDFFPIPMPGIDGRLAIAARPRGGDWLNDDLSKWQRAGFNTIVSLLTESEIDEFELHGEEEIARTLGLDFASFEIEDRGLPSDSLAFAELALAIAESVRLGRSVLVHCRQGIGRASLLAVAAMVSLGSTPGDAIEAATLARGVPVPETDAQRAWLRTFRLPNATVSP